MIDVKPLVDSALCNDAELVSLLGGERVYFQVAADEKEFPRITYYELDNRGDAFADDEEISSEIYIVIDIWNTAGTTKIAKAVVRVMKSIGFGRDGVQDLYESDTKIFHKYMRYKTIKESEE